ncbi:MAG: hypothetical protein A6F71_01425 [Cycloclasticus sp. symbiont of Poecilosclerida sp. M]|nr:MAG: hypothetical protein A6F71_01425 [Cycloclasticus sp. symbiont of Poecilosclerida sp. M]
MPKEATEKATAEKSTEVVTTTSLQESSETIAELIRIAKLTVYIYSPSLTPRIFNTNRMLDICQEFALRRPQNKIDILVDEASQLHKVDHQLLKLSQRCSSRIAIKIINSEIPKRGDEFVCIDKNGYFHRPSTGHVEAHCCFDNAQKTAEFLKFFHESWELSASDSNLRSMLL